MMAGAATVGLICRLDIPREILWYWRGGTLPCVADTLIARSTKPVA